MEYILLPIGLLLLIKGADIMVDGAAAVAKKLRVPPLIVGLTVISFGTSAPEAAIGIASTLSGGGAISLGNVIGSNFFNLLAVVGVTALAVPLTAENDVIRRDMPVNFLATGALALAMLDGVIVWYEALVFLAALGIYLFAVIKNTPKAAAKKEDGRELSWLISIIMSLGGLVAIVIGGDTVVDNAKIIAANFGMSETLIGLTVVALGTSLPELVTSLAAARKGEDGIAIGNAVGSCLFNILFILGISGILKPLAVEGELLADVWLLATVSVAVYIFALNDKRIGRAEGAVCVILYAAYTAFIILRAYGFI